MIHANINFSGITKNRFLYLSNIPHISNLCVKIVLSHPVIKVTYGGLDFLYVYTPRNQYCISKVSVRMEDDFSALSLFFGDTDFFKRSVEILYHHFLVDWSIFMII